MFNLFNGNYHIFRKISYIMDWEYVESDAPTEKTKRQRHLCMNQIRKSKIKLKSIKKSCLKKNVSFSSCDSNIDTDIDTDSESDIIY